MKKLFQIIGILTLMIGSFILTNKVQTVSRNTDELLTEIKSKKDGYKENAIEPMIKDDTIIPGINGKEVDVLKSYEEMSKIGYFDDKLLIYKTLKVENTLDKNKDKYITGLNSSQMVICPLFILKEKDDITEILKVIKKLNIKTTFFITSGYLEKHHNQIIKLVEEGHTIGNLSNNENYEDSDFVWLKTIITNIGKQKYNYCLTREKNKKILKTCKIQDSYTILTNREIKNKPLINVKKYLEPGSIIIFNISKELNTEFQALINYTNSRGYIIKPLEEGLKE
ncbi:MAG: polysaccharide deacetylase family protein [Bacilli bacterium]|nr:polysaccharide deacetylase family protein [Bacilli bacterium]